MILGLIDEAVQGGARQSAASIGGQCSAGEALESAKMAVQGCVTRSAPEVTPRTGPPPVAG